MNNKLSKFLVVVFLTLLIWTWAFMSQEKTFSRSGILAVSPNTDPSLLVTFSENDNIAPQTEIPLTSLTFKGAPSKLSELQKRYDLPLDNPNKERLDFYYDPAEYGKTEGSYPLSYQLNILDYLQKSSKVQDLTLSLESCIPSQVTVNIEKLVEKELPVQCVKNDNSPLKAIIDPPTVTIYVRKGYPIESATVVLSPQLIETARKEAVSVTPYVDLGVAGVKRKAASPVQITLKTGEQLEPKPFKTGKPIGIIMSPKLQNEYRVTILNDPEIRVSTTLYATTEAFKAYQDVAYPFLIEIKDSDVANLSQIPPKEIIYNFPPAYVKKGEIELADQLPRKVDITIEPIQTSVTP